MTGPSTEQRKHPDMWVEPEEDPRTEGDPQGELATYREYLANYRLTLQMKCDGLDPEQLARRSVPPSSLSLLGMVRHMARVEHHWFQRCLKSQPSIPRIYDDGDAGFKDVEATQESVDEAFAELRRQIALADEWLDALTGDELGDRRPLPKNPENTVSIRDVLVHMIEEYARHAGHADLLRECIDGRTGQ